MASKDDKSAALYRVTAESGRAIARPAQSGTCGTCGGRGVVSERDELGYEVVRSCECRRLNRRIDAFNRAHIPGLFAASSLQTFRVATDPSMGDAHQAAVQLVRSYPVEKRGLCLLGPVGVGKTHLVTAIVRELTLGKGVGCIFCDNLQLLQDLKLAYEKREGTADLLEPLANVEVLVIDDLGKGRGSEWEITILDDVISRRYNAGATTIVTTNYIDRKETGPRDGFATETLQQRVGSRIHSRLHGMCKFIEMQGEDFRRARPVRRGRA